MRLAGSAIAEYSEIVRRCVQSGLVDGKELAADGMAPLTTVALPRDGVAKIP